MTMLELFVALKAAVQYLIDEDYPTVYVCDELSALATSDAGVTYQQRLDAEVLWNTQRPMEVMGLGWWGQHEHGHKQRIHALNKLIAYLETRDD